MNEFIGFLLPVCGSLVLGACAAWMEKKALHLSGSMCVSLAALPMLVCSSLLIINGSLGAGIAILGVFSLVRFRSLPGSSTDIVCIFHAMVIGLLFSAGSLLLATGISLSLDLILALVFFLYKKQPKSYEVRLQIPENVTDLEQFSEVMDRYGKESELLSIRTASLGTLIELKYRIILKENKGIVQLMEKLRQLNGNLPVSFWQSGQDGMSL